jgi:hypothetical protein
MRWNTSFWRENHLANKIQTSIKFTFFGYVVHMDMYIPLFSSRDTCIHAICQWNVTLYRSLVLCFGSGYKFAQKNHWTLGSWAPAWPKVQRFTLMARKCCCHAVFSNFIFCRHHPKWCRIFDTKSIAFKFECFAVHVFFSKKKIKIAINAVSFGANEQKKWRFLCSFATELQYVLNLSSLYWISSLLQIFIWKCTYTG